MQRLLASVFVVGLLAVAAGCGTTDDESPPAPAGSGPYSPPAPADESREATEQGDDGKSPGSGETAGEPPPEDEAQANAYEVARENCADAGLKEVAKEFGTRQNEVASAEPYGEALSTSLLLHMAGLVAKEFGTKNEVAAAEAYGEALSKPEFFASSSTGCLAGLLD